MKFGKLLKITQEQKDSHQSDSVISPEVKIIGDISFSGSMRIDGKIEGDIIASSMNTINIVHIGEGGEINGTIKASEVIVEGLVNGDIHAYVSLSLMNTASLKGNAFYNRLSISEGAECEGKFLSSYRNSSHRESELELITHQESNEVPKNSKHRK